MYVFDLKTNYKHIILSTVIGCLLSFFPLSAFSQKILALDKPGKVNRIRYKVDDFISLKTVDKQMIGGNISFIGDSSFQVGKTTVKLSEIKYIKKTQGGYGWSLLGNISLVAGLGYFGLDASNRIINGDKPIVPRRTAISSSICIGIFAVTAVINSRKYKINNKRRLKIIDLEIAP